MQATQQKYTKDQPTFRPQISKYSQQIFDQMMKEDTT